MMLPEAPALLIVNPAAGSARQRRLAHALKLLEAGGCRIAVRATAARGDAEAFARNALAQGGYRAVIAAGGDGTINEVVNGLAGGRLPLGILPLGTANVLALELGLRRMRQAVAALCRHEPRDIVLGRCNDRYFTLMAGAGFDARVVAQLDPAEKKRLGRAAYGLQAFRCWRAGGLPVLRGLADGVPMVAASLVLANGRHYGGPQIIAPEADTDRADLIACRFERGDRMALLRLMTAFSLHRLHLSPLIERQPVRRVDLLEPAGEPVQADGDIIARLPVTIEADAARLPVLR